MFDQHWHESAILGGLIYDPSLLEKFHIDPEMFEPGKNQAICAAILEIAGHQDPLAINIPSVTEHSQVPQEYVEQMVDGCLCTEWAMQRSYDTLVEAQERKALLRSLRWAESQIVEAPSEAAQITAAIEKAVEGYKAKAVKGVTVEDAELVLPSHIYADVEEVFRPTTDANKGIFLPWTKTHQYWAMRKAEVTVWGGYNGSGKSIILSEVTAHLLAQDKKIVVASMEMRPSVQLQRLYRQLYSRECPSEAEHRHAVDWIGDKLRMVNLKGTAKASRILDLLKHSAEVHGAEFAIVDSLAKCGYDEDDYNGQKNFVDRLTDLALETNLHIHLVCHSRKRDSEESAPTKLDIKGTGAITDMVDNVFLIHRNKKKEQAIFEHVQRGEALPPAIIETPNAFLGLEKNRDQGHEIKFGLWYWIREMRYVEHAYDRPEPYLALPI